VKQKSFLNRIEKRALIALCLLVGYYHFFCFYFRRTPKLSGRRAIYREGIARFLGEYLALFTARYFAGGNGPLQRLVM
jgi:hypothetical protein